MFIPLVVPALLQRGQKVHRCSPHNFFVVLHSRVNRLVHFAQGPFGAVFGVKLLFY